MSTEKTGAETQAGSLGAVPTPDEIDAADLMGVRADVPSVESLQDFWFAEAIDPSGETRAYGFGYTPAGAAGKCVGHLLGGRAWLQCCSARRAGRLDIQGLSARRSAPPRRLVADHQCRPRRGALRLATNSAHPVVSGIEP
jgi:hypothetical protein